MGRPGIRDDDEVKEPDPKRPVEDDDEPVEGDDEPTTT